MSSTTRFRLVMFGFPRLFDADGAQVALGTRAATLLAILSAESMPQSRARLAALLWSDRAPAQARASLRQCLLEVRRAFVAHGATMPIDGDTRTLHLAAEAIETDLAALQSACAAADPVVLEAVLTAAPPRPLLDEVELPGAFGGWLSDLRSRVETDLRLVLAPMLADAPPPIANRLARARLLHSPGCPLALTVINGAAPVTAPLLRATVAVAPLAADAPPAVVVQQIETADDAGGTAPGLLRGIREEVVSGLARFRELRVVVIPDGPLSIDPARLPQSGYALFMTLRGAAGGRTVSARLTALDSGELLWGDRFSLLDDSVQETIELIISRIVGAVTPIVETHLATTGGDRPAGALYARYLAAKMRAHKPPDYATAQLLADEFETILAQSPRFAAAHLPLARLYNTDFAWTRAMSTTPESRARAFALASNAVAIDRGSAHGHSLLGWCHLRRHEWEAARRFFDEAVRLNPFHAVRLMEVAYGLLHLGDLDASEALLRRCLAINPVADDGFHFDLGMLSLVGGDAIRACDHLAMIAAPDPWGRIAIALAAVQAGRPFDKQRAAARETVAAMWPNGQLPAYAAMQDWVATRHPFRLREHRERFAVGLLEIFG